MTQHEETIAEAIDRLTAQTPEGSHSGWLFAHDIDRSLRSAVLRRVMLDSDATWRAPFVVMLALSAGVATLGLSQDSAATVIGAMVIAPLAAPIAAMGAAIALAWVRETLKMLGVALAGAAMVVAIAYVIGFLLPPDSPSGQILARTSPDLRDLGVAVFAGAAGAYAQTRKELLSTLVGVAIAVALVPPLAAVGLMLEANRIVLARGAATLFAANLTGIMISAAVVLLATRYAPLPRLRRSGWAGAGLVASAVAVSVLVAIPLVASYRSLLDEASLRTAVYRQVVATLGPTSGLIVDKVTVQSNGVTIELSGTGTAPPASTFQQDLVDELGPDVPVTIKRQ